MVVSEVLALLRSEGRKATPTKIKYAVLTGRVPPLPYDSVGNRNFGPEHVDALRRYLDNPPKTGRRPVSLLKQGGV